MISFNFIATIRKFKSIVLLVCMTWAGSHVDAQTLIYNNNSTSIYKGFEASYGIRSFGIQSDIARIHDMPVLQEGGQIGLVYGFDAMLFKVGVAGFFYSASKVPHTINMFESDVMANFYPLTVITGHKGKVEPYLTGGLIYNRLKFFGHYLGGEAQTVNYSYSSEPFLGIINQVQGAVGIGLAVSIRQESDFLRLFVETKYSTPLASGTRYEAFSNTSLSDQLVANIGVRFGAIR